MKRCACAGIAQVFLATADKGPPPTWRIAVLQTTSQQMPEEVVTQPVHDASHLVADIAAEIGKLAVEIAAVATDPQQYMTRYIPFLDRALAPICDVVLQTDERMVFCAFTDHNLLIPSHNPQFRKPHGADPIWNASNGRNRRIYKDKTAVAVSRNARPYLLQTYRRDMGGGIFALMKDASAPVRIEDRLWGGLRVCYRA